MLLQLLCFGVENKLPLILSNQIHFVYEAEYLGFGGALEDGVQASLVVVEVHVGFSTFHVENVYENLNKNTLVSPRNHLNTCMYVMYIPSALFFEDVAR